MLQDTLPVVVDAVVSSADSLADAVGALAGTQISSVVTLVLGVVTKFVVDLAKGLSTKLDNAPGPVKALVATAFAQVAAWVTAMTGVVVNPDITALETTVGGLVVAFAAMGVHGLVKAFTKK
jgi:hypothetical protein